MTQTKWLVLRTANEWSVDLVDFLGCTAFKSVRDFRRLVLVWCSALMLMFAFAEIGIAQSVAPDLQQEIEALKKGQQAIQKELQELRQLLQARRPSRPAAPDVRNTVFNIRDNPVKGEQTAKLTLIEFTDYQ